MKVAKAISYGCSELFKLIQTLVCSSFIVLFLHSHQHQVNMQLLKN